MNHTWLLSVDKGTYVFAPQVPPFSGWQGSGISVLDVRRLTLTPPAAKRRYLGRVSLCLLRVSFILIMAPGSNLIFRTLVKGVLPRLFPEISVYLSVFPARIPTDRITGYGKVSGLIPRKSQITRACHTWKNTAGTSALF